MRTDNTDANGKSGIPDPDGTDWKRIAYALLREKSLREVPPLPDKPLDEIAAEEGAVPFESFIGELEELARKAEDR